MSSRNPTTVIAFYQQQQQLQAVEIRRHGQGFELLWQRTTSLAEETWASFAERCGVPLVDADSTKTRRGKPVVVGFSAVGVASYRLELPAVGDSQLADMVHMQSEARLPLPLEQMELGWRRVGMSAGQTIVTAAAARRQRLAGLVNQVKLLQPITLCLDSEALVALGMNLAENMPSTGIVMALGEHTTHVCRVEDGQLSQTAIIDCGRADLIVGVSDVQAHALERFTQDLEGALVSMGDGPKEEVTVHILSDGRAGDAVLAETLSQQQRPIRLCSLHWDRFRDNTLSNADLWEQRVPIGLALRVLEADNVKGLFHHLCRPQESREVAKPVCSLRSAIVWLILALLALGAAADMSYSYKERHLQELCETGKAEELVKEREVQKTLAQYRPDLLDLLTQVNDEKHKDITIDEIHFERGQAVRIIGHTKKAEDMYAFEEGLLDQSGIKSVSLEKEAFDKKAKVFNFTVLLHYKTFTKKQSSR
ncbi:hypothetical protein ACFL6U_02305 [Planctomycetota bacterium]